MTTYATEDDLAARLSSTYSVPANAAQLLDKASELIDFATQARAAQAWVATPTQILTQQQIDDTKALITKAACDQVEFWLEAGEEHDVLGLRGALQGGRVQIQNLPTYLGQRPMRDLL